MTTQITAVSQPRLNPSALRWRAMRGLMRLGARLSHGIALGFRHGFDSGPMLDYVYRNRAQGAPIIGPIVDRLYLNQIGWRAIRARRVLLERVLLQLIEERRANGDTTHIVDIAAGPGRYLLELIAAVDRGDLSALCRDLDPAGQAQGRALADELGLRSVTFQRGDATDPLDLAQISPRPDIVIASGIYELLTDDRLIMRSMAGVHELLPANGVFVFTTQVRHPQLDLIANVLPNRNGDPWIMLTRPLGELETWVKRAGFAGGRSFIEPNGLFAVSVARRGAL
ncbi:MAG: class I SAM-dependent methyltransferase family protein [Chloroflexi bacterium]|nr:class I SAM-dependent methyltransferase family protein [Chloroflexota bacterium]